MEDGKAVKMGVSGTVLETDAPSQGDVEAMHSPVGETAVRRDLKRRHINMIAIAGMIGTGLFLASGQAVATGGPVGALFGYICMGLITWGIALMTGEISSFMPVTGGFVRHATKFVQPAVGVATGFNFWYSKKRSGDHSSQFESFANSF